MKGVSRATIYVVVILLAIMFFLLLSFKYFRDLAEEFGERIVSLIKVVLGGKGD